MPLYENGLELVRANLALIAEGKKPSVVEIGYLTEDQHAGINKIREKEGQPLLLEPVILFMGRHFYESRTIKDGYTIDDMVLMVKSSLSELSIAHSSSYMTGIINENLRDDGYGNKVKDLAVFELYQRRPRAELYSVMPKGDKNNRPVDKQK